MKLIAFRTCAFCLFATVPLVSLGQGPVPWQGGGIDSNWTTAANWDHPIAGGLPTGAFDESAVIDNGDTVLIDSDLSAIADPNGPPGALEVSNSSTLQIVSNGAFRVDDSGEAVDGSASFAGDSMLTLTGPNASFHANSLSFSGGSVYNPNITTDSGHGLISVSGAINTGGGALRPTFDGYSPVGGDSWLLADAASINGEIAIDESMADLPLGRSFSTPVVPGGVNGQQLFLELNDLVVLSIDADTGAASLSSPTGPPIDITAYGLASASGQLNPSGWSSLESQGISTFDEAGTPSANLIDELAGPVDATTQGGLTVGTTPQGIGNPFAVQQEFGVVPDLTFNYVTEAGELQEGIVNVTGLNAVNNLLLTVDPSTGEAELVNSSLSTLELRGYSILSDSGALKPNDGDWDSLDDQGVAGVEEANGTATSLSELIPEVEDTLMLGAGQTYQLGDLFNTAEAQDLELEFLVATSGAATGDYNADGTVDAADYTVWRDNLGGDGGALANRDSNSSGPVGMADYEAWKDNFGATGTAGGRYAILNGIVNYESLAPGSLTTAPVPEPGSACLLAALAAGIGFCRWPRGAARLTIWPWAISARG